jgi:hypothetical protein
MDGWMDGWMDGTTHGDEGHLAKGLVRDVRLLLVRSGGEVDGDEFVGDVALFGDLGHAPRASGHVVSVELERCHDDERGVEIDSECSLGPIATMFIYLRIQCFAFCTAQVRFSCSTTYEYS